MSAYTAWSRSCGQRVASTDGVSRTFFFTAAMPCAATSLTRSALSLASSASSFGTWRRYIGVTQSVSGGVACVFFFVDGGVVAVAVVVSDAFSGVLGAARVSAEFALPSAEPSCATKSSILYRSRLSASRVSSGVSSTCATSLERPGMGW